ncbi:hypothetical protein AB0C12_31340 [Actinoplanes sp. NPDC048967]|uniref:hypothetical protein n=1 Tax=Actinoplanes sp. NPDC048967 TaxID=3155269 RepID=UPI0033F3A8F3
MSEHEGSRWWIGAALVPFTLLMVLRGLRWAQLITDGPLARWYTQVGIVVLGLGCYAAVHLLLRRAYRRRS